MTCGIKPRIKPKGKASRSLKAERARVREHFKPRDTAAIGPQAKLNRVVKNKH